MFLWDFGGRANTARNAMTADLSFAGKMRRCSKNTLVCTRGKVITKKRNVYAVRVTFHTCAVFTPLNP